MPASRSFRPLRTSRPRLAVLVSVAMLAASATEVEAQQRRTGFLPSTIVPNYDRVRIGQTEGLEGGAYVARSDDSGANWYNPAGLALADQSSLNASSSAYEWTTVTLAGLDQSFKSGRFRSLGTYFGGVLATDGLGDRLRLGFSVTRPVVWSPGAVSGSLTGPVGTGAERIDFYSSAEMTTMLPAINAGFRLSERVRIGGGVAMGITTVHTTQQLADRFVTEQAAQRNSSSLHFDGQHWQMQFTAGAQWDPHERVRVGATLSTPGIGFRGSALVISQTSVGGPEGTAEIVFRDSEASFEYQLPSKAVAGVAVDVGRLEVEANVRYYGSREQYDLLSTDAPALLISTDPSGTPSIDEATLAPVAETTEAVTNLALGVNYPISDSWRLHAGAFTDGSPVGDPERSAFGKVDLTGLSFAVSFGGRLSGSVGLSSSWGTSEEGTIGPTLGGVERQTTVSIRSVNLHYALSYTFN